MSELPELVVDREFDAPREMVWRAWTDPELTFTESDGKTNVHLSQTPFEGSDDEIAGFARMMEMIKGGWGSGYVIMVQV